MDGFVYIFGYGGQDSPIKVTTMRVFSNIELIIELLLKEFSNDQRTYRTRIHRDGEQTDFEMFMSRWSNKPKVYIAKLNDEKYQPKLIKLTKWKEHLNDFYKNHPDRVAKLLLTVKVSL